MKRIRIIIICTVVILLFTACANNNTQHKESEQNNREHFQVKTEPTISPEQIALSESLLKEISKEYEEFIPTIEDYESFQEKQEIWEHFEALMSKIEDLPHKDTEEFTEIADELYLKAGRWGYLNWFSDKGKATFYFQKCSENSDGYKLAEIFKMIEEGNKEDALKQLVKNFGDDEDLISYMRYSVAKPDGESNNLADILKETKFSAILNNHLLSREYSENWVLEADYSVISTGIENGWENYKLNASEREELNTITGTKPDGKILVLHKRQLYEQSDSEIDIHVELMEYIPAEYLPENLEETEYVILIDANYTDEGKFNHEVETIAIKENATISVYKAGTTEPIYVSDLLKGTAPVMMFYRGDPPEYYAGTSPDATAEIKKCMELIIKNIDNSKE